MGTTYNSFFMVSGVGHGCEELVSFDAALVDSGIGDFNLVRMSSILPSGANKSSIIRVTDRSIGIESDCGKPWYPYEKYKETMIRGSLIPVAYAAMSAKHSPDSSVEISSAVAVAIPKDDRLCGLIMEYHGFESEESAVSKVKSMCIEGMILRGREYSDVLVKSSSYNRSCVSSFSGRTMPSWYTGEEEIYTTVFSGIVLAESR